MNVTLRRLAPGSLVIGLIWLGMSAPLSCANSTTPPPPADAGEHHKKEAGPKKMKDRACGAVGEPCCEISPSSPPECDPGGFCSPMDNMCKDQHPSDIGKPCYSNSQCSGLVCGYTQGISDGQPPIPDGNGTPVAQSTGCTVLCQSTTPDCMPGWTCSQLTVGLGTCVCNWTPEICDGQDNNCDGIIDNEPEADNYCTMMDDGIPQRCHMGACECVTTCASQCVDINSDDMNCGKCGHVCKAMVEKCQEGKCGCAYTVCDGECVNTGGNDGKNCGDCGKVCDFTCTDGTCGPNTVASSLNQATAIAVDNTNVYWLDRGTTAEQVQYCPVGGCGATPGTLAVATAGSYSFSSGSEFLAVTPTRVYFADLVNSVEQTPIKGGSGTGMIFGTGAGTEPAVAVDGVNVYWANRTGKTIHSCPIGASCGTPQLVISTSAAGDPTAIAVSGANVYILAGTSYYYPPQPPAVYSAPISGAGPLNTVCTTVSSGYGGSSTSSLVVAGSSLYWFSGTSILTCPLSGTGSAATTFYSDTNEIVMLATDGISLYFVDGSTGYPSTDSISKCPLGASCKTPTSLISGTGAVKAMAVGADALYWIGQDKSGYSYTQSVFTYAK